MPPAQIAPPYPINKNMNIFEPKLFVSCIGLKKRKNPK